MVAAVPKYIARFKADPTPLIAIEWVSDEEAGPVSGSGETKEAWTARMKATNNSRVQTANGEQELEYFELVRPNWRSEEVRC